MANLYDVVRKPIVTEKGVTKKENERWKVSERRSSVFEIINIIPLRILCPEPSSEVDREVGVILLQDHLIGVQR